MKTIKIRFSALTHMSNLEFLAKAGEILKAFEREAALLPAPPVSTVVLRAAIADLNMKNSKATGPDGSHNRRMARNLQRTAVYEMLVLNGQYAVGLANLKETYEEKCAFVTLASYPIAHATRTSIEKLRVTGVVVQVSSMPGTKSAKIQWNRGRCAAFIVQGTQHDPGTANWEMLTAVSQPKCELEFAPGRWTVRVIGVYNSGHAEPSNWVSFIIG